MRLKLTALLIACFTVFAVSAQSKKKGKMETLTDSVAYAMGLSIAENLKSNNILNEINIADISLALNDAKASAGKMTVEQANEILRNHFTQRQEKMKAEADKKNVEFFAENKAKSGVIELPSGLQYKIEREGTGPKPTAESEVEVNYKGTLLDGTVFDSSYDRGEPVSFPLNRVIPGWTEGLQQVGEGGKIMLWVPAKLGYGENGMPGSPIGPNSLLIFEVELLKIKAALPEFKVKQFGEE